MSQFPNIHMTLLLFLVKKPSLHTGGCSKVNFMPLQIDNISVECSRLVTLTLHFLAQIISQGLYSSTNPKFMYILDVI